VGTNDALAKADVEAFTGALAGILEWLNQHDIDAVLVGPPYNSALVSDEHYTALRAAIRNGVRQNGVPVVLRFEALQYLALAAVGGCEKPVRAERTWLQVHGRARCTHYKPLRP
jgi:acyl-CoA thioesterase I